MKEFVSYLSSGLWYGVSCMQAVTQCLLSKGGKKEIMNKEYRKKVATFEKSTSRRIRTYDLDINSRMLYQLS